MAEVTVKVESKTDCPHCGGQGYTQEEGKGKDGFHRCSHCKGDGVIRGIGTKTVTTE